MAYKLAIAPIIEFELPVRVNDGGRMRTFNMRVQGKRLSHEELAEKTKAMKDREFLLEVIVGWSGQKLVLDDETGEPAAFGVEALDAMLSGIVGLEHQMARAYVEACWDRRAAAAGN